MMKRRLALCLVLALLAGLLAGCDTSDLWDMFSGNGRGATAEMVPFGDMEYARPDLDAALSQVDDLIAALESSDAGAGKLGKPGQRRTVESVKSELDEIFEMYYHFRTMFTLARLRSDIDTTDSYYREESDYCSDAVITLYAKLEELFAACAASPLSAQLEDYFWDGFMEEYGEDYVYPEALIALQRQENELVNRYYAEAAAARVTWEGQEYTLDELYQAATDGALAGLDVGSAITLYYSQVNQTLGSIYVDLVRLRHQIAAEYGYDSYTELAYAQNGRDYGPEAVQDYTAAIRAELVPLYEQAAESGLEETAFQGTPTLSSQDALMTVMDIAESMGGDMAEVSEFLLTYDLYDVTVSDKKVGDSYETYLLEYEAPFILVDTIGYAEDLLGIAHEFGHAVDDYVYYEAADGTDVSETLSQAMEYLMLPRLQDDELYETVTSYKLMDVLRMYAEQGSYNAFEERVYALEDWELTLENVNAIALETAREYGMTSRFGDAYDSMSWVEISHFFEQPFYIISYLASDSLAIQFYEQELAEEGRGLALYEDCLDLAGDTEFMELAQELEMRDPLSAEQIHAIAELLNTNLFVR